MMVSRALLCLAITGKDPWGLDDEGGAAKKEIPTLSLNSRASLRQPLWSDWIHPHKPS